MEPFHDDCSYLVRGQNQVGDCDACSCPGSKVTVFHAGTKETDEGIVTNGGRVLGVVAIGENLEKAREAAYASVQEISFEGAQYRTDIAAKAMKHQEQ